MPYSFFVYIWDANSIILWGTMMVELSQKFKSLKGGYYMDIRTLQYFVAVVECGNISIAAKKLHMTQPPLSKQIQNLESELNVVLMERGPRNITLTAAGKKLYEYALSIIDISNIAVHDIRDFSTGKKGTLRIGCASSCSHHLLSIISEDFSVKYPDITYQVFEKNTFELVELLEQNIIEIAILRSPFPNNVSLNFEIITSEKMVAVARPEFFGNEKGMPENNLDMKLLSDKPVILYRRWETFLKNRFKILNVSPKYICINDDARTSLSWAKAGMGIAVLPPSAVHDTDGSDIICREIDQQGLDTSIAIAWKNTKYVSHALESFIETALGSNSY